MTKTMNPQMMSFNDLVFDQRNKSYGAYVLRREYDRHALVALLIGTFVLGSVLAIPYVSALFKTVKDIPPVKIDKSIIEMILPPEEDRVIPPQTAQATPPPSGPTIQSLALVVSNDIDTDDPPAPEEFEGLNPGKDTKEGTEGWGLPDGDDDMGEVVGVKKQDVFTIVERMPEFPGGEKELMLYLSRNIKYPVRAKELGIQGIVYVEFVVDEYGHITNVQILRGIGGGCDEEAARVIAGMPRWTPGKQSGRSVKVQYRLPIHFTLKGE
jgi:protein TonB